MKASQKPTFERVGNYSYTDGDMAAKLAAEFFGEPLPWQKHVLNIFLARKDNDKYAFPTVALSVPRQNGKSWDIRARVFYGIIAEGEKVLYTCQHGDTADEMFKALSEPFEDEENEELHELLRAVRKTNGQQAIYLNNGGVVRFTTRTNSLARGKTYSLLVYDEAQDLTRAQQEASRPAIRAAHNHNPQVIYAGTPPNGEGTGDVFNTLRQNVLKKKSKTAWIEWSIDKLTDPQDKKAWYKTNPSLGVLVDEETFASEAQDMSLEGFNRECLGFWSPEYSAEPAIPPQVWKGSSIDAIGDNYSKKTAFGIKFSADGSRYALCGAKLDKNRNVAVELVEEGTTERGTRTLAEALYDRRSQAAGVVIDGQSGAAALCDNLFSLKAPKGYIVRPRATDVIDAASAFLDGLKDGTIKHTVDEKQPALANAAKIATKRPIGARGGWGFGGDAIEIEAATLAVFAVKNIRRNPKRRQMAL